MKKFELIQRWKNENGGSIINFDDLVQIKGISSKTVKQLKDFCSSQISDSKSLALKSDVALLSSSPSSSPPIEFAEYEYSPNNDQVYIPEGFAESSNDNFIIYDESIPPMDLSVPNRSEPMSRSPEAQSKYTKTLKLALEPKLFNFDAIRSFTTIYQEAATITWTKFLADQNWNDKIQIDEWSQHKITTDITKNLCQVCDELSKIVERLPTSDVYIIDDHIKVQHFRKAIPPKKVAEIVQVNQQYTALVTLLLQKQRRNEQQTDPTETNRPMPSPPNVHFMSYNCVGRLYNLHVGHETISTQSIVKRILNNFDEPSESLDIHVNDDIKQRYFKSFPVVRECLGRSLLTGLTFIRLGLLKQKKIPSRS